MMSMSVTVIVLGVGELAKVELGVEGIEESFVSVQCSVFPCDEVLLFVPS